eukprot:GDKI01047496.1.p2 GENE.GDKI01047496.1~~GDKI01047496.1.p2  ORF type:complete len:155 (-),score=59.58 GDKI01047496.1:147-611(-)
MGTIATMSVGIKHTLIPKKSRKAIHEYLFKEGVIVVKKDATLPKHADLDMPNIHVMMALKSLCSKKYVDEKFNWCYHYYTLTNEGIEYLREYLHLPATVFPATYTKARPSRPQGERRERREGKEQRDGDFKPEFRGEGRPQGRGRGRAPAPADA